MPVIEEILKIAPEKSPEKYKKFLSLK